MTTAHYIPLHSAGWSLINLEALRTACADIRGFIARSVTKPMRASTTARTLRIPALVAMTLVMAGAEAAPAEAPQVGWHPATSARPMPTARIDPNTFIVQPPVAVTWLATPAQDAPVRYAQTPRAESTTAH